MAEGVAGGMYQGVAMLDGNTPPAEVVAGSPVEAADTTELTLKEVHALSAIKQLLPTYCLLQGNFWAISRTTAKQA